MNELGKLLQKWWDSDDYKAMIKSHKESIQKAVGKYHMLSEEDKIDMVQAICHIMCKAESEGTSHRGLQDALGIYPAGFWVDNLMEVHNALWSYYDDRKKRRELKDDLDSLENLQKVTKNENPE